MSENTINAALRRLGYTGEDQAGHGFRSMASTLLNEQGFPPDVIELQLAHFERNKVRAAYNKAQRLPERRKMMQEWADYLDGLRGRTTDRPVALNKETERRRAKTLEDSEFLPMDGRTEIDEELTSALAAEQDKLPVTDEQRNELDGRLKAMRWTAILGASHLRSSLKSADEGAL
jgi:hypothetical protein